MRALTADRQALTVTNTFVGSDLNLAANVSLNLTAQQKADLVQYLKSL